ncbi:hypothetical protein Tco_0929695, partial [Tanacetum coccineum]
FPSPTLISLEENELIWEEFEAYLASDSFPLGNDDLVETIPEEFTDELALIESFLPGNDDMTPEDVIRERECLLTQSSLANYSLDNDLVDTIPEMFADEHALDYSSPPLWDDYDDELFDLEPDNDYVYDDPFDFKEEKIKESKLLIDELNELDPPRSSELLPFPEFTNCATMEKNVKKTTDASLIFKDFNPSLYELPFHKEVPGLGILLSFSSKNEEKVSNPEILTSKGVHTSLLPELSHRGSKAFKVTKIFENPMKIFPCSCEEDIRILDVPCFHFYPP